MTDKVSVVWQEIRRGVWWDEPSDRKVYGPESDGGKDGFCISSHGCWMPGTYATREVAERAFELTEEQRCELRDEHAPNSIPLEAVLRALRVIDRESSTFQKVVPHGPPSGPYARGSVTTHEVGEPTLNESIRSFLDQPTLPKIDSVQTNEDGTVSLMSGDAPAVITTPATLEAIALLHKQRAFDEPVKTCARCEWAMPDCTCDGVS